MSEACLAFLMPQAFAIFDRCRWSVNVLCCVKLDNPFWSHHLRQPRFRHSLPTRLHLSTVHSILLHIVQYIFCTNTLLSTFQKSHFCFLFQFLINVMTVRKRKSQMMSGCHMTKVLFDRIQIQPARQWLNPRGLPYRDLYHCFNFSMSQTDGFSVKLFMTPVTMVAFKYAVLNK